MALVFQVTPQMRVSVSIPVTMKPADFLPVPTLATNSDIEESVESVGERGYCAANREDA